MLLPGQHAARVRRQAAELVCRFLGGDTTLVDEVCRIRGFQEELAANRPDDPRRVFGEAVESSTSNNPTPLTLAKACTDALAAAVPGIIEKVTQHIDQRLAHLETRQRVNLNVRAKTRPAPYNPPPIARSIDGAGRPLPVAKYLDEKQRLQPAFKDARRSFAPAFGMLVQCLKKKQLKEAGEAGVYVEISVNLCMSVCHDSAPLGSADKK